MSFRMEVATVSAANDVREGVNSMIRENPESTIHAMKDAGLTKVTVVSLTKVASVLEPPPRPLPTLQAPPPPESVVADYESGGGVKKLEYTRVRLFCSVVFAAVALTFFYL